jgi:flagellar protein FlaF
MVPKGQHVNAIEQARQAYAPTKTPLRSPRSIEHMVFTQATSRMQQATAPDSSFAMLAAALNDNRRLWTLLAADVADTDNTLPQALRAQIFYLAEFTIQHTRKVLKGEAGIAPLVDINAAMMRGLTAQDVG